MVADEMLMLGRRTFKHDKTMFARGGSALFRNEIKPFYWLDMTLVRKSTNRMASFHFGRIRNRHGRTQSKEQAKKTFNLGQESQVSIKFNVKTACVQFYENTLTRTRWTWIFTVTSSLFRDENLIVQKTLFVRLCVGRRSRTLNVFFVTSQIGWCGKFQCLGVITSRASSTESIYKKKAINFFFSPGV